MLPILSTVGSNLRQPEMEGQMDKHDWNLAGAVGAFWGRPRPGSDAFETTLHSG